MSLVCIKKENTLFTIESGCGPHTILHLILYKEGCSMERDSVLYDIRRKCQVVAHYILPDKFLSKLYFRIVVGKNLDIDNPKTFNEKIQWLKLYSYPYNQLVIRCADKYRVRSYLMEKGLERLLVPLIGDWDNANKIDWDMLPDKFVLKCNHGCAYNIVCNNKKTINKHKIIKQLEKWMNEDFGAFNVELHYSKIKPHITCEEFLGDCITDYKFFCFNGKPRYVYVSRDLIHDRQAQIGFFYLDGKKMPMSRNDYVDIPHVEFPAFFDEMKKVATILSKDFQFVRVDFFLANGRYYFAELTFTPGAGMMPFNPDRFDLEWGNLLKIKI